MEGLFYSHDYDGTTFFWFYQDGRVVSMSKYNEYDQSLRAYPWFKVESDTIHYLWGSYKINNFDSIDIAVKGDFGKMVYHGELGDRKFYLQYRCPFTNSLRYATYTYLSVEHHIIHLELHQSILN